MSEEPILKSEMESGDGGTAEATGAEEAPMPAYEQMLPEDLPVLEEELSEATEDKKKRPGKGASADLARRLVERPLASAMVERLGRLFRFLANLLFAHVLFEQRSINDIRAADKRGTVVYAMESRSRLDYLYFNYAFLKHDLPLARIANDVSLRPVRRLWNWFRRLFQRRPVPPTRQMEALVRHQESAFIFLERPRHDAEEALAYSQPYLYRLIQLQRRQEEPIFVMPLLLVWAKRPDPRRASFLDDLFGTAQSPGFFRKVIHYVQTFWQSFLRVGQPMVQVSSAINLQDFLREYPNADSSDASELLRSRLEDFIGRERRVILGPTTLPREAIHGEVMKRPELTQKIREVADEEEVDEELIRQRARDCLDEISADPKPLALKVFSAVLSFVWYRIYDGFEVDEEGLEEVREAARSSSIVLVPSHKSHIDYLVLSYVFYHYGMMAPHIAAGVNLSFWPLGPLFRRAGAFFIRRSFRGEDLYPVVFREYLIRLMEESYPIEFFIEGTRSRTGKLIKPKYGMLDMMVRAFAEGRLDSVKIVPISVGYEKIIEERSYRREMLGEEKQQESLAGLLRTPKFLTSKKGRLYVEFDDPIDLEEYFARFSIDRLEPDDEELDALTVRLAHRIIYDINQITTVSPTALAATVLLNNPERGLDRGRLLREVGFLLHFLTQPGRKRRLSGAIREALSAHRPAIDAILDSQGGDPPVSLRFGDDDEADEERHLETTMGTAVANVIDRALAIFEQEDQVHIREEGGDTFYSLEESHRLELSYYRNTIVQHFVPEGLLATALLRFDEDPVDFKEVMEETRFLSRLFKYEWIYEERAEFENVFRRTLSYFSASEWVSVDDDDQGRQMISVAQPCRELNFFRRLVLTFLEAYAIIAAMLDELHEGRMERDKFVELAIKRGRKSFLRGDVIFSESISKPTFINALRLLEDWGAVKQERDTGRMRETAYYSVGEEWSAEKYWNLQKRLDALVYRDWELRNRIAGHRRR